MKRWALRICVFLLLGAIVNVAVAWGFVLYMIGGPTALIEVGGWRLLTDPTFDPPGRQYTFGWGKCWIARRWPLIPDKDGVIRLGTGGSLVAVALQPGVHLAAARGR